MTIYLVIFLSTFRALTLKLLLTPGGKDMGFYTHLGLRYHDQNSNSQNLFTHVTQCHLASGLYLIYIEFLTGQQDFLKKPVDLKHRETLHLEQKQY